MNTKTLNVRARDGLKLAVHRTQAHGRNPGTPLVCLPGLTRDARDFRQLATFFANHPTSPRTVLTIDARGRGQSEWSADPKTYNALQEADDVLSVFTALDLHEAVFIGTSRGGIIAMILAVLRGGMIKATVLNDIAHKIDIQGLLRLRNQFGPTDAVPGSWDEAAAKLQTALGHQFPTLTHDDWLNAARQTFVDRDGLPARSYDPRVVDGLSAFSSKSPSRNLTPQFRALCKRPVLLIRGAYSDLLSEATATEAVEIGSGKAECFIAENEGHAPSMSGAKLEAIADFLRRHEL
ncbi:MAG: alpha/beta hydrolase [Pseudomonadota bacterium]